MLTTRIAKPKIYKLGWVNGGVGENRLKNGLGLGSKPKPSACEAGVRTSQPLGSAWGERERKNKADSVRTSN